MKTIVESRKYLMIRVIICFFILLAGVKSGHAGKKMSDSIEKKVRSVMQHQEDAWNEGNINSFMETYLKSPELVFVGGSGPKYGWEEIRDNYKKRYPNLTAMGKLKFDILKISQIDHKTIFLIGKFHLSRSIGDLTGHFTLILQKIRGEWLIISDHSSSSN